MCLSLISYFEHICLHFFLGCLNYIHLNCIFGAAAAVLVPVRRGEVEFSVRIVHQLPIGGSHCSRDI